MDLLGLCSTWDKSELIGMFVIFRLNLFIYFSIFFSPSKTQHWDCMEQAVCWWGVDCLPMEQRCYMSRLPVRFAERCLAVADGPACHVCFKLNGWSENWGLAELTGLGTRWLPWKDLRWNFWGNLFQGRSSSSNNGNNKHIGIVKELIVNEKFSIIWIWHSWLLCWSTV